MEAGEVNMKKIYLGDYDLVTDETGRIVGLDVGTGLYAIGAEYVEALEATFQPPLGVRGVVTWSEAAEALGIAPQGV